MESQIPGTVGAGTGARGPAPPRGEESADAPASWRGSPLRQLAMAGAFLLAYVVLEWASFMHEYQGVPITPWNPGIGVVFALMVLGGPRYAAVLFAGVAIAEVTVLQTHLRWPIVLGIAAIFAGVYGAVAAFARSRLRLDVRLHHLRDVLVLLLANAGGAVLAALLLSLLLLAEGQLETSDVLVAAFPFLVGDILGMAVMTPLTLRLLTAAEARSMGGLPRSVSELLLYVVAVAAVLWIVVGAEAADGTTYFYLLFLPVVVAALRYGLDGACVGLALAQFGLVGVMHLHGFDARAFTEFQILMLVLSATGLIVGVVVSERRNADRLVQEAEARLKEKEAEAADAARHNLVGGMASALAHEINQPMTAARALARSAQHLLGRPEPDLRRAGNNLADLIANIDHAGSVIAHMRDFLRRGRPRMSTLELRAVLEDASSLLRAQASAHGIAIDVEAGDELPPVHGDRVQLQQVVLNFVHNALDAIADAGRRDGRIRITATRHDAPARIEIGIWDNGPGVRRELADRLFAPLTTSKVEGLGLGLSICAAIVATHGGRVWLHSGEPGATEFRFSIPLAERTP